MRPAAVPILAGLLVATTRVATLPRSFWQGEEIRFARALLTFDPFHRQPEAPGYPLFIGVGRLMNIFVREPYVTLVVVSVLATFAGAILVSRLAGEILGHPLLGAAAALLLYLSPPLLVFTPLPGPEALTLALLAATFFFLARGRPELFAVMVAATIGCAPQLAPAMVVVFLIGWATMPQRSRSGVLFAFVLLICFVPLIDAIGRDHLREYAERTMAEVLLKAERAPWRRFGLLTSIAVLLLWTRRPRAVVMAMTAFGLVYLTMWLLLGDVTDRTQPLIPLLLPVSVAAAAAFIRVPVVGVMLALLFGVASWIYVWPIVGVRRREPSPPIAAVRAARDAVLVAEPLLEPHASLSPLRVASMKDIDEFADQPESLLLLVHDRSESPGSRTFAWPDSHPYGVITSERYREVSLVPLPPERRYRARAGVYPPEGEWRWLARESVIELPGAGQTVTLRFRLPVKGPLNRNRITVAGQSVEVTRGKTVEITVPAAPRITIRAETSVTPPGDRRDLAVQLVSVERH